MKKLTTFYIIRHGETDWNATHQLQGQTDRPLNEKGYQQAKELAEKLKHIDFDAIFSSDLERAIKTAEAIALERKLAVTTTKALREKSYGRHEGKVFNHVKEELRDLFEQFEKLSDDEKFNFKIYHEGETDGEAVSRFIQHLREIAVAYSGKTVLVASHGGLMKYLLIKLGVTTYKDIPRDLIQNAAYIKLENDGIDFYVKELSGINLPHKRSFSNI